MENLIKFIKIDIVVQKVLFFVVVLTGVIVFPLMITLPILGAWQLLSAMIIGYRLKDKRRMKYLLFSIVYLVMMVSSSSYMNDFEFIIIVIYIPIPFGIAIWYYGESKDTLKYLQELEIVEMPETMDDILDSEEIFKKSEKL